MTVLSSQVVTKESIGLGNVDNTSDLNKPISTATQLALDDKVSLVSQVLAAIPALGTDKVLVQDASDSDTIKAVSLQDIANLAPSLQSNLNASVAPSATDDSNAGYSIGSLWIDTTADEAYRCVDNAVGAAVWVNTSLESTDLASVALSGDSDDLIEGVVNLLLTSAERTKLGGIEAGATADQTDAEIKTAYENNADTNAFTDADETKLDGITAGAEPNAVDSVNTQTGAVVLDADDISDAATTNKYTTAGDISKLAGIESGATADQSDAEIKTAYENNANTNAFTDAEQTKLGGIEALADVTDTANVTAAGALMDSEVDADIKTLSLPASTTISAFGASLVDDAAAVNARTTLGLTIGTDVQAHSAVLDATTASFLLADETKLDGIEASADVTDEDNVTDALDGATLSAVTVAGTDKVLIQDTSDTDILKTVTAQSIADLAAATSGKLANHGSGINTGADVSSTTTTFVDVFSIVFTPVSASNVVLINLDLIIACETQSAVGSVRLLRDTTVIFTDVQAFEAAKDTRHRYSTVVEDTPATASAITYKVQIARDSGTGTFIARGTSGSPRKMSFLEIKP